MSENEIKYVVRAYAVLEEQLTPFGWIDIDQGYLHPNARIRRITYPDGEQLHLFTYKQRLPNGENLELPSGEGAKISKAEFDEAWEYTNERLCKRRITFEHHDVRWDVDFFRWGFPYFVLAEVEMPPGMQRPEALLPYLEAHIVFEVPRDDGRFSSRNLADEGHVRKVARELGLPIES